MAGEEQEAPFQKAGQATEINHQQADGQQRRANEGHHRQEPAGDVPGHPGAIDFDGQHTEHSSPEQPSGIHQSRARQN